MKEKSIIEVGESRPGWEALDAYAREGIRRFPRRGRGGRSAVKSLLVRIGIDQAFGGWNAPVGPVSGEFVYVPIPEQRRERFQVGMARSYGEVIPRLDTFCRNHAVELTSGLLVVAEARDQQAKRSRLTPLEAQQARRLRVP